MQELHCFSGLGNSASVARRLSQLLPADFSDPVCVFPVHAWGVPPVVEAEVRRCDLQGKLVHMVCTCGSETGRIDRQWRRIVTECGGMVGGIYSVVMPNSYVCMPFMNVDSPEVAARKLEAAGRRVETIASCIAARHQTVDLALGPCPGFLNRVLHPWFFRSLMKTRKFHCEKSCTGCGACARSCPKGNISMVDGKPQWGADCTFCLRCYHGCPTHSVAYGRFTRKKGQYLNPDYKEVIKFSEK